MIEAFGATDVGRRRKLNEDNFLVDDKSGLFAVCDGMGGHNAGEIASKMSIETIAAFIQKSGGDEKDITWPYGLETELSFEGNRLKTATGLTLPPTLIFDHPSPGAVAEFVAQQMPATGQAAPVAEASSSQPDDENVREMLETEALSI